MAIVTNTNRKGNGSNNSNNTCWWLAMGNSEGNDICFRVTHKLYQNLNAIDILRVMRGWDILVTVKESGKDRIAIRTVMPKANGRETVGFFGNVDHGLNEDCSAQDRVELAESIKFVINDLAIEDVNRKQTETEVKSAIDALPGLPESE